MDIETERMLRRLALAGRMEDVRAALLDILDDNANDEEAKAELRRLINGQALRLTLSAEERTKLAQEEAWQALERDMIKLPFQQLKLCSKAQLEAIFHRRLRHTCKRLVRESNNFAERYLANFLSTHLA